MSQANMYSRISEIEQASNNNVNHDGTNYWVTVYFKETYTTNTKFYNIKIDWTIEQFLSIVKEWIIQDFDLDSRNYSNYSIDIIEMCQEIPGINSEDAPKLEEQLISYCHKYMDNGKWPGFYIKVVVPE